MPAGRPTSLTPEVAAAILDAIRAGNFRETACKAARIAMQTLRNWEQRAEAGEEPYASFVVDMHEAEAEAEKTLLGEIRTALPAIVGETGPTPWQARAWVMERRWPKRWSGRVRVTVADEVDSLTRKLAKDPELHRRVLHVLADEESSADGATREPH